MIMLLGQEMAAVYGSKIAGDMTNVIYDQIFGCAKQPWQSSGKLIHDPIRHSKTSQQT